MKSGLIIFIKNPEKGKVKTRIAKTAGEDKALAIYKALMEHTRKLALLLDVDRHLFYSQQVNFDDAWKSNHFQKKVQQGEALGQRMSHAFQHVLERAGKAVIIGSDCASLSTEIIETAFAQLDQHDCVIGPALDGGYYLLGMKKVHNALFENIAWSTDSVFEQTRMIFLQLQLSFYLLPVLSDIDHEEDWEKYGWKIEGY